MDHPKPKMHYSTQKFFNQAMATSKTLSIHGLHYHGSKSSFQVFDLAKTKTNLGLWLSPKREIAEIYAQDIGGQVLKFDAYLPKVAEYSITFHNPGFNQKEWRDAFIAAGYDGLAIENGSDSYIIAFSPDNLVFVP